MGREVRGIAESELAVFHRPGKICEVIGNSDDLDAMKVRWQPHETCMSWTSRLADVEFLPPLKEKQKFKSGKTSYADLAELRLCLPEFSQKIKPQEKLTSEHIVLGSWLIFKELVRGKVSAGSMPFLLLDNVVHIYLTANAENPEELHGQKMAEEIIQARFRRHGLLGVPICFADHWTLLVFRRSATSTQIRYYDSLPFMQEKCLEGARKIVKLLLPDASELNKRHNQTFQVDEFNCGFYALWYWEAEIRQFMGEGWSIGRPHDKEIAKCRTRLIRLSEEVEESKGKELTKAKKKKVAVEIDDKEQLHDIPMQPRYEDQLAALKKDAKLAANQGAVPFYGCPKCRNSRGGCIWWKCNPDKFLAHVKQFPEKYASKKELVAKIEKKIGVSELKQGEFDKL